MMIPIERLHCGVLTYTPVAAAILVTAASGHFSNGDHQTKCSRWHNARPVANQNSGPCDSNS
jgi:hypothetical protein